MKYLIINIFMVLLLPFINIADEQTHLSIKEVSENNFAIIYSPENSKLKTEVLKKDNVAIISYPENSPIKLDRVSKGFLSVTSKISLLPESNSLKIVVKELNENISIAIGNEKKIVFEANNYPEIFASKFTNQKFMSKLTPIANAKQDFVIKKTDNGEKWIFNYPDKVAAAFFKRGEHLWLVFNKYKNYTEQNFKDSALGLTNFKQIQSDSYSILTFKINKNLLLKSSNDHGEWVIEFSHNKHFSYFPASPIWQYNSPYSKGIFFPIEEKDTKIVTVNDPFIGDNLEILTTYNSGAGVPFSRKFIDFNLLATAQGMAIVKNSTSLSLNILKQGIEFLVPENNFSRSSIKGFIKSQNEVTDQEISLLPKANSQKTKSIISFRKADSAKFIEELNEIYSRISKNKDANSPEQKNRKTALNFFYSDLLSFLFSNALYYESASLAKIIDKNDQAIKDKLLRITMIEAVSNFMIDRFANSITALNSLDYSKLPLVEKEEIDFWVNLVNIELGKSSKSINYLQYKDSFLASYPVDIRRKILIDDIENSLIAKDNKQLSSLLMILESLSMGYKQLNDLTYYQGKLAAQSGQVKKSLELWNELTQQTDDQKNRVRATIDETMLNYQNKLIDINQAIDRLNTVTIAWRGDEIEAELLKNLGDLYLIRGDYLDTLKVWNSLLNNYYNRENYMYLTSNMSKILNDVFVGKYADQVSDIDAVIIYFKYENLIPIGSMGDKIAVALADRLYSLDLIDLAEKILLHQINYRVGDKEKTTLATKLAEVYYNNRDYNKSLDMLKKFPNSDDQEILDRKNLLTAENLFYLGEYDKSMDLLKDKFSPEANNIKSLIFQQKEDWLNLKRVLLVSLESKKDYSSLNSNELFDLQRLAIALFKLGDEKTLIEYYNKFKDEVPDINETKALYNFLIGSFEEEKLNEGEKFSNKRIQDIEDFLKIYSKSFISPRV